MYDRCTAIPLLVKGNQCRRGKAVFTVHAFALVHTKTSAWNIVHVKESTSGTIF